MYRPYLLLLFIFIFTIIIYHYYSQTSTSFAEMEYLSTLFLWFYVTQPLAILSGQDSTSTFLHLSVVPELEKKIFVSLLLIEILES